jgi:hypothetical protein
MKTYDYVELAYLNIDKWVRFLQALERVFIKKV